MEMFHQASMKLGLDRAVLAHARIEQGEDGENPSVDLKMSLKEIDALLKRGAYDVFREDDSEQKEFEEADIDAILQRRAHKVVYNEGATSISSLSNFSKASFVSADEKEDVDINDPDFWKKAVGLREDPGGELNEPEEVIVLNTQRKRKQTTVYGEMHHEDEEELRRLLKQPRNGKNDKTEKMALKAALKEQQQKEKLERDEARKAKQQEELRQKNDPKSWGPHGRDRVLRALNMFGNGRWYKIKSETNKELMETKDLIAFCNYYIFQCGLCAGEQDSHKGDNNYVTAVIREAKEIEQLTQLGKKKLIDFPPCLAESRFLIKLKAGLARKSLNKLDTLTKLNNLMQELLQKIARAKDIPIDDNNFDIDKICEMVSTEELIDALPFGDVRPGWARSCPWWDLDCDKHLIVGVFKHGYGQYEIIKEDDAFIFKRKLAENLAKANKNGMSSNAIIEEKHGETMNDEELDVVDAKYHGEMEILIDEDDHVLMEKIEDGDDVDDDNMNPQMGGVGKSGAHNTQPGCMPDPRHLNRIVCWLVTADLARMSNDDSLDKNKGDKRILGRRSLTDTPIMDDQYVPSIDQGPHMVERAGFETFKCVADVDGISLVYKPHIGALNKCMSLLMTSDKDNETLKETGFPVKTESNSFQNTCDDCIVTEEDALKLSATFILYGAPVEDNQYQRLYAIAKDMFGIEIDHEVGDLKKFTWKSFKEISKTTLSEQSIQTYYTSVWIPFCQQLISQTLSNVSSHVSTHQEIPLPSLPFSDHSLVSRGLCQIFFLRQQIVYAINYILSYHFRSLIDYLRDMRGRSVDNMPIWWCPWIHDLALMLGILKHGYLAVDKIFSDAHLPFHRDYLRGFVRKVFLIGCDRLAGVAKYDLRNNEEAERFLFVSSNHYPDAKDVEIRVFRIVEELTSHLSSDHPCKIIMPSQTFRQIVGQSSQSSIDEYSKTKIDSKVSRNVLRGPAMSLNAFINTSRKRRKSYAASYHPEFDPEK